MHAPRSAGPLPDGANELPSGTVTLLFTDIQGSTSLLKRLGAEAYATLLARHHELLRAAFAACGGVEVDNAGDGLFVVFRSATAAVAAAAGAQRAVAGERWRTEPPVRVRMGLHTGEVLVRPSGYVGRAVHHAARVSDLAHGGQVLLSAATAVLVEHELPPGVALRSLGRVAIADADEPQPLSQLAIEGLQSDFPPLRAKQRRALVPNSGRLLERTEELALLADLARGHTAAPAASR